MTQWQRFAAPALGAVLLYACAANIPKVRNAGMLKGKSVVGEVLGADSEDFQRSLRELAQDNPDINVVEQGGDVTVRLTVKDKKKSDNPRVWTCGYTATFESVDKAGRKLASGEQRVEFESPSEPVVCSAARMQMWAYVLNMVAEAASGATPAPKPVAKKEAAAAMAVDAGVKTAEPADPVLSQLDGGAK